MRYSFYTAKHLRYRLLEILSVMRAGGNTAFEIHEQIKGERKETKVIKNIRKNERILRPK